MAVKVRGHYVDFASGCLKVKGVVLQINRTRKSYSMILIFTFIKYLRMFFNWWHCDFRMFTHWSATNKYDFRASLQNHSFSTPHDTLE